MRKFPGVKEVCKGTYEIRVTGQDTRSSRRVNQVRLVEAESAAAAFVLREGLRQEIEQGLERQRRMTLTDYARLWLPRRRIKASTRAKYLNDLERLLPILGGYYLDALRPSDIAPVLGDGWAGVNRLRMLRALARDAAADRFCDDWTARLTVPYPRRPKDKPNLLSADELRLVLDDARENEPQWHPLLLLMATTGLRWGEASALRWADIDRLRRLVCVRGTNWKGSYQQTKTEGSEREVPIGDDLLVQLGRLPSCGECPYVFPARAGTLHRGTPLTKVLNRIAARLSGKAERITPHGLRRTFNDLGRRVASREAVKAVMGHVTDASHERYSRVDDEEKREVQLGVLRLVAGGKRE